MRAMPLPFPLIALMLAALPAAGDPLLSAGEDWRALPFEVRDGKPMLAVRVGTTDGVMMLDNGTPESVFLNRDGVALPDGPQVGKGSAASGQTILVHLHPAPGVTIAGRPFDLPEKVMSGNFGFVQDGLGADFLGFIGTPAVQPHAFTLDYARQTLTLLRVTETGALAVPPPSDADILARIDFAIWPGQQPTTAALIGDQPILLDFDTGDGGTIYLRPATRRALEAAGHLRAAGDHWLLGGLAFGGARFAETPVALIDAGGPQDFRTIGHPDMLRLGAAFLAQNPSLWNFPAHRITFLNPGSAFLAPR